MGRSKCIHVCNMAMLSVKRISLMLVFSSKVVLKIFIITSGSVTVVFLETATTVSYDIFI